MKNVILLSLLSIFVFTNKTIAQNSVENISTNTFYNIIQDAINSSNNGDTLIAQPGIYLENINFNGKNIVLASEYFVTTDSMYIDSTIIDGNQTGSCVVFENGEDTTTVICGFTITNGNGILIPNFDTNIYGIYYDARLGGGIYCKNSSPMILSLKIIKDSLNYYGAYYQSGSGIFLDNSNAILINCNISDNIVSNFNYGGGTIYCSFSNIQISNSKIQNNIYCGGIISLESNVILKNVILSDNSSSNLYNSNSIGVNGGGIMATNSNFIVNNVSIINNEAGKYGGGLYSNNSKFEINNSIIQNNISQYVGGIFIENSDSFSISNTRIFENLGLLGIGGVTVNNANLKMTNVEIVANIGNSNCSGAGISYSNIDFTNCLFTNNEGHNNSCGLYISYSEGHLINNTIANNFNYNHEPAVVFNSAGVTVLNSIIYENFVLDTIINPTNPIHYDIEGDANMAYSAIGYLNQQNNIFSQGNIQTDPYFVNPIQTIPYTSYQNLNYELLWNSPCIDAGIDFYVYNGDTILDLDSSEYLGSAPDMGYYEYKFKPSALIDIGVTKLDYPTEINCGLLSNESIILSIRNFGSQAFSNFYIYFSISQNPIDSILVNNTILSNTELEIQISNNFDFSTPGAYEIVAWTEFQNDTINTNDSLFTSIFSGTKIDKFPYFTDFENDNGYWKKGSEQSSWECGQPNGLFINSATSGTNVWATNLANYCYFENSFVESPCFDFTNLLHPTIEFNYWIEVYLNDGVALQSSIDDGASWQYVGAIGDTGNWYNITCSGLDLFGANIGAWNASGYLYDWLNASHLLEYLSGEPIVKFRFVISTSLTSLYYYYDGFAFDDFSIYDLDLSYVAANDLQKQFILHQNKPNPFVETTEISFYIPKQTEVEISIYNILGEKIQTLVSKTYSIGEHSIKFNSKNYNPGTYFYKMTCPDFVDTKNMIILE